jgi:hypothetical protein
VGLDVVLASVGEHVAADLIGFDALAFGEVSVHGSDERRTGVVMRLSMIA